MNDNLLLDLEQFLIDTRDNPAMPLGVQQRAEGLLERVQAELSMTDASLPSMELEA